MDLGLFQSILYGLITGLSAILPVSEQAHRLLLMKFFGIKQEPNILILMIHIGILIALYYSCQNMIIRILRARSLARIPKRRRKRPLDTKTLMDFSLWKTMILPVILVFFFYQKISFLYGNLMIMAGFLFLNGIVLYIPQFLPGSNKDSRTLSRVDGLLMGLGGAASVLPGVSGVGVSVSIGSVCGVEPSYGLDMTLFMDMAVMVGFLVFDVIAIASAGFDGISFGHILNYLLAMAAAFGGTTGAIKLLRLIAVNSGYSAFAYYCWGMALFSFILNLMA